MIDVVYRNAKGRAHVEHAYREVLTHWPVSHLEHRIMTHKGQTFVIVCGPEHGPPLVLLHGAQANSAAWLPDIARLASRFRVHAIDMIGEAGFSAPVRPALTDDTHARWLDDVFAGLGLANAMFVGTSLGGWLALDYASRRSGFATALALVCPAGIGRQKNFLLKALPLMLLGPWGKRKVRELVFGPALDKLPAALDQIAGLMGMIGRTIRPRVVSIPQLTDDQLAGLAMPILAIIGGRDPLIDSVDTRYRLQCHAPSAEIVYRENGYHFLPNTIEPIAAFLEGSSSLPSV